MFSAKNLPALIEGSDGMAYPTPGVEVLACKVPCQAEFPLPASWGGGTKIVGPEQRYWICAVNISDVYPNNEFEDSYELSEEVDPGTDDLANVLWDFWKAFGFDVKVYRATKTKPAIVVGIIEETSGEFETAEGPVTFNRGDILLESPINRGQMWPVPKGTFNKKYQGIRLSPATA